MYEVELTSGPRVRVWRAGDAQHYFCHGLTFGGKEAPGGPISPFSGKAVETILQRHYHSVPEPEAKPGEAANILNNATTRSLVILDEIGRGTRTWRWDSSSRFTGRRTMYSGDDNLPGPEAPWSGRRSMAEQPTTLSQAPARAGSSPLACRIRIKQAEEGRRPLPPGSGEVELENTSSTLLQIELQMSPLQYLNLIVQDAAGNVISEGHYGERFSPVAEPYTFCLEPGQKYTHNVALLGTVPETKRRPGRYIVQAVYQARGLTAVSTPLALELPPRAS
jgi:hypothetical protein